MTSILSPDEMKRRIAAMRLAGQRGKGYGMSGANANLLAVQFVRAVAADPMCDHAPAARLLVEAMNGEAR